MASEADKGRIEVEIFKRFAKSAGLNCAWVEKQSPAEGKPDLKCLIDGETVYFELTEACSEDLAKAIASPAGKEESQYPRIRDYTTETYKKKIRKKYAVNEPIELLIYNIGRTILPDEALIDNIRAVSERNKGPFRKVWYFGEHVSEL